ncbi:MAG: RNB domain-containing ribonuclease [Anaerolineae bacterium]
MTLIEHTVRSGSLVLYKNRPARVAQLGDKLDLDLPGGESAHVRPKDIILLHSGPVQSLGELTPQRGDVQSAWELLAGSETTLPELADLIYGAFTPATAWAAWQLVSDGLFFRGTPAQITACSPDEVEHKQQARRAEVAEKAAWAEFAQRVRQQQTAPGDARFLREVEAVALGRQPRSRVLRDLEREETPESAHALLLETGFWPVTVNPYPQRLTLPTASPDLPLPALADEARRDLTHLPAFAIDDARTTSPDDAISLDADGRIWVHVADAAALVRPDDPADEEARGRGATLYLPESVISLLPWRATELLGLGLQEISPALSFGIGLDANGQINSLEITPSRVRVTRLTYEAADAALDDEPLASLWRLLQGYHAWRQAQGAVEIDLPEVDVFVQEGTVVIEPAPSLRSRSLVENAMILTGHAVARFALQHDIPLPFATQEVGDEATPALRRAHTLSQMLALRKTMRRSQYRTVADPHGGLGLPAYVQTTSPLRRCLDLVVHQQLRRHLAGQPLLSQADILARIGAVEAVNSSLREAENKSNTHWTLVYLLQHPDWQGEGILVDKRGLQGTVILPELGLEPTVHLPGDLPLDTRLVVQLRSVDLPRLDARFRIAR